MSSPRSAGDTYVALGDSLTSGSGAGLSTPAELTWPSLLAHRLADAWGTDRGVHRLAVSGATSAEVRTQQLPRALALRPRVASVVVGLNDARRTACRADELTENLGEIIGRLTSTGTAVLMATMHDPTIQLRLPSALALRLRTRVALLNEVIRSIADDDPAVTLVDFAGVPELALRAAWARDRVHLSLYGHEVVAAAVGRALGLPPVPLPTAPQGPSDTEHLRWLLTSGCYWLVTGGLRRSLPLLRPGRGIPASASSTTSSGAPVEGSVGSTHSVG